MNLYEKLGKEEGWYDIIFQLYCELVDHPEIAHHFIGVNIEVLSKLQTQYLCMAFGSPHPFMGKNLKDVHKPLGITPFQFKVVVDRVEKILKDRGVERADINTVIKVFKAHRGVVVTKRSSWIDHIMMPYYRWLYRMRAFSKG